jgi:alpha-ketoglutarate-dependent taurine dioxygenase
MKATATTFGVEPLFDTIGAVVTPDGDGSLLNLSREAILSLFKQHGALLFRGFDPELEVYQAFSDLFCAEFITYMGGGYQRQVINPDGDQTILSVNYYLGQDQQRTFGLPLHGEMYYIEHRPDVMFFYCVHPASLDGETTVADGALLYQALSPKIQDCFKGQRLKYIRSYQREDWQARFLTEDIAVVQKFCHDNGLRVTVHGDDSIDTEYISPGVMQPPRSDSPVFINNLLPVIWQEEHGSTNNIVRWEDGSQISADIIEDTKAAAERCTRLVAWRPLEILMVDNSRVLHGRMAFEDKHREIYTRMGRSILW